MNGVTRFKTVCSLVCLASAVPLLTGYETVAVAMYIPAGVGILLTYVAQLAYRNRQAERAMQQQRQHELDSLIKELDDIMTLTLRAAQAQRAAQEKLRQQDRVVCVKCAMLPETVALPPPETPA